MRETGLSSRLFDAANVALMFVLMAVTLYPMLYVLFASFSDPVLLANEKKCSPSSGRLFTGSVRDGVSKPANLERL